MLELRRITRLPMIVAADWNNTPQQLQDLEWLEKMQAVVMTTDQYSTCRHGERLIDFVVVTQGIDHLVDVTRDLDADWQPHDGLHLTV